MFPNLSSQLSNYEVEQAPLVSKLKRSSQGFFKGLVKFFGLVFFFSPPSRLTRTSTHLILAPVQQRSVVTTINPARQPMAQTARSGRSQFFAATLQFA